MIEISRNQANALVAGNCPVPAYLTINGIQQEYRVTQVETERSDFSLYGETPEMKFVAELEKVHMSEGVDSVKVEDKVETKQDRYTIKHIDLKIGDYLLREDFSKSQWGFLQENWKPNVEWYSSKEEAMTHFSIIRVFDGYEEVRIGSSNGNEIRASDRRITPEMLLWVPMYNPENMVVTWGDVVIEDFSDLSPTTNPKKEKPELKYTELWMADTSNDMMGVMSGYLTHWKYYEVLSTHTNHFGGLVFKVVNDAGYIAPYGACWFKPVRLYDEDESELICRDIEFKEGDYIDLRKHTPEQIRHIAKFFQFYNLKDLLSNLETNPFIYWDSDGEFVGIGDISKFYRRQDEYTYDDIFYSEES